jgi:hypothetical protein
MRPHIEQISGKTDNPSNQVIVNENQIKIGDPEKLTKKRPAMIGCEDEGVCDVVNLLLHNFFVFL